MALFLIILPMCFLMIGYSATSIIRNYFLKATASSFQRYSIEVAEAIAPDFSNGDEQVILTIMDMGDQIATKENQSTRILVTDQNGVVIWDSYNDYSSDSRLIATNIALGDTKVTNVLNGIDEPATSSHIVVNNERKWVMYTYAPITVKSGTIIGSVLVSTSLSDLESAISHIRNSISVISILIIIVLNAVWIFYDGQHCESAEKTERCHTGNGQGKAFGTR